MQVQLLCMSDFQEISEPHLRARLEQVLQRFSHRIHRLVVRLSDENGPKGGVDQRCTISLELDDGTRIHASGRAEAIAAAVDQALRRVLRVLTQSLHRRQGRSSALRQHRQRSKVRAAIAA